MQPLATLDAAFVHLETPATPMHVGAVFVLHHPGKHRQSFAARLRRHLRPRLGLCPVFTRRLAPVPLDLVNPFWFETGDVDLERHVRAVRVPAPGGRRELDDCIAALHETPLDRDRPLWEIVVLEGLAHGRVALYFKVHHAGLDGATAQLFLRCFADAEPAPPPVRHAKRPPRDDDAPLRMLAAGLRHQAAELARLPETVRGLVDALGGAAGGGGAGADASAGAPAARSGRAPRTPLNVAIDARRTFASVDVPMAPVRAFAKREGVTINDVLLAACAGAVRRWLADRDALPAASLLAAVPVSLRAAGDTSLAIRVSFATVPLHTNVASPRARLAAIAAATRRTKGAGSAGVLPLPTDAPSLGIPWLIGGLARLAGRPEVATRVPVPWNVLVSNVPGPPMPLYVLGTRVLTYTPVSIPFHGLALNVTVYSYDGRLYFGLTAAKCAVPDAAPLARLVLEELRALQRPGRARTAGRSRPAARQRNASA